MPYLFLFKSICQSYARIILLKTKTPAFTEVYVLVYPAGWLLFAACSEQAPARVLRDRTSDYNIFTLKISSRRTKF